ncbi:hypothetical protein HO173_001673 [Letharia columbiana]|uniref:Uncharacterized protein n=1 Tax=Letharia columbiana TaxID=112416 RepID=A0A8H6G3T8_9LECA|nr:uncharacterized protein HO173_001673 [Letharia columbiana]KAF6240063.1 hypothetical protein HO173_001673 [Letharia columbiana]
MGASFFYKLFSSTVGSMPAQYDPDVDSWWGIVLTELGSLDPFREENISYLLVKFLCTALLALFLWALSLCNTYKNIKNQRDEAREDSRKGAYEWCDLHLKLRDTENELYHANEKLQDADSDMCEERKGLRDTIQGLNDQHLVYQEEIRSLEQDVWNTESDRDGYSRQVVQVSKENEKLKRDLSKGNNQLSLAQAEVQTLQENLSEVRRQRDLAQGEMETLSMQVEPQHGQATPVVATLKARPKPTHRRTQRPSSLPKPHRELLLKGSKAAESKQTVGEKTPEALALEASITAKDQKINDLEQEKETLTAQIGGLRIDLEKLSDEHNERSEQFDTQLAEKDGEIRKLQAEKTTADKDSAGTIATLRTELGEKEKEVADLEEANDTLVAEAAPSADTVQRLNTLSNELEESRLAHGQCDEDSTRQSSRIDQLVTAKEQLEEVLEVRDREIGSLQGQVTHFDSVLKELQEIHAKCGDHTKTQDLEIMQLRNASGPLQDSNNSLLQQLGTARAQHANLIGEGQQVQNQNKALIDLQSSSQREIRSLQGQIEALNQTVDHQQRRIQSLETNCPNCQKLREALDELLKDANMSDDAARVEMRREVEESVRAQLRSQVGDDLRRQIRGEVEREVRDEFQNHYRDVLALNTKRIREQNALLLEKDAKLEEAKNAPTIDHAAFEKEANLQSTIIKLEQNAKIAKANNSRLTGEAKHYRQQFEQAQPATEDLRSELEQIKADQRRAQNVNPLQSKLLTCQRELENMKVDRNKARDNCSTYSNQISILRKGYEALENELVAFREKSSMNSDSTMNDGRTEEPIAIQKEQQTAASASDKSTEPAYKPAHRFGRRPARLPAHQPTRKPVLGEGAGVKREHDECSDGEADDEGDDDRKKAKIERGGCLE